MKQHVYTFLVVVGTLASAVVNTAAAADLFDDADCQEIKPDFQNQAIAAMGHDTDALLIAKRQQPRNLFDRAWRHHRERPAVEELAMVGEEGLDVDGVREHETGLAKHRVEWRDCFGCAARHGRQSYAVRPLP